MGAEIGTEDTTTFQVASERATASTRPSPTTGNAGKEVRCRESRNKDCHWLTKLGPVDVGCRVSIESLSLGVARAQIPPTLELTTGDGKDFKFVAPKKDNAVANRAQFKNGSRRRRGSGLRIEMALSRRGRSTS